MKNTLTVLFALILLASCGGEKQESTTPDTEPAREVVAQDPSGLTAEELKNGIGPISSVELGEIDEAKVAKGKEIFDTKCMACHKMEEKHLAPPLFDVLERRTPEYAMNMMLNPLEMQEKHPEAKKLKAEYNNLPMTPQGLTEDDARAMIDYIRAYKK